MGCSAKSKKVEFCTSFFTISFSLLNTIILQVFLMVMLKDSNKSNLSLVAYHQTIL